MERIYCIPTNRRLDHCLNSYIKEVDFVNKKYNKNIPIVIIESKTGNVEDFNKNLIKEVQVQYPNISIIHYTIEKQKKLFSKIFTGELKKYFSIFMSPEKNYGNAMNKIYLIAMHFNVDIFHRRDSDTFLLSDYSKETKELFPLEIEIKYLGKKVDLLNNDIIKYKSDYINELITVVGGNYYGEWNLDIKDFAKKDFNYTYKLYELLGFDKEYIKEICDESFKFNPPIDFDTDILTLVTTVNDGKNPDCGNMGMYKLFERYPMLPARNTLASDYFTMDTATALNSPSLHHNRSVFHTYSSERFIYDSKRSYWEGVLKFADYFNLYSEIYECNDIPKDNIEGFLASKTLSFKKSDLDKRKERLFKITDEFLMPFNDNYKKLALELRNKIPYLIEELNKEYELHSNLILDWQKIRKNIKELNKIDS